MRLFGKKEKKTTHYVGVDLGASGMKLVELASDDTHSRLMTYGYANLAKGDSTSLFEDHDRAGALLKQIWEKSRCTTKRCVAALPISSVFSSIVSVERKKEKEMDSLIRAQVAKLLPMPIEDVVLDTKMIDSQQIVPGEKLETPWEGWARVLVTAAPKTLIARYTNIFQKSGLELLALETEVFAHVRSLIGKDRSTVLLVDSGIERTNISVIEKGVPFMTRSIASGGMGVTEQIAKALGVTIEQAETMKRDIRALQSLADGGDVSEILTILVKPVLDEIRYTFQMWKDESKQTKTSGKIDKIILTGGGTLLPGFAQFITSQTNVNAYLGDPWARVVTPEKMRPILDEIGSRFAVSLGCALREMD